MRHHGGERFKTAAEQRGRKIAHANCSVKHGTLTVKSPRSVWGHLGHFPFLATLSSKRLLTGRNGKTLGVAGVLSAYSVLLTATCKCLGEVWDHLSHFPIVNNLV